MVKVKQADYHLPDGSINVDTWLQKLSEKYGKRQLAIIRLACHFAQYTGGEHPTISGQSCLQHGLTMAEILVDLNADEDSIAAAILYNNVEFADLVLEDITEQVSPEIEKLIRGTHQMEAVHNLPIYLHSYTQNRSQIDNIRKMLLAMVEDVRVVLIKLAERLCMLRYAANLAPQIKKTVAHEAKEIYAPLASRLGIGHIKWELEDYAFRYLEPKDYKALAKKLDSRRIDRENYVEQVKTILAKELQKAEITQFEITGRAKHIYSIHRKMLRKNVDYEQIYDAIAVRVLVNTIEESYTALSIVHSLWEHIPEEFDDYISNPKPNGYRSLHTAVHGPDDRSVEVQIRTQDMHQESELGVAAHWKYKEGSSSHRGYEEKINWLRQVLDWQNYLVKQGKQVEQETTKKIFGDRIYVFTPNNEIVDLPSGATPLDFAYHIHTEIGHRCKGAKVNKKIVPLTYKLKTGEQIEIIRAKEPHPSRDWLNVHAGYLYTSRAKAKVLNYFKQQDVEKNKRTGQEMLDQELTRHHLAKVDLTPLAQRQNYKSVNDMLASIGRGDASIHSLVHQIQQMQGIMPEEQKPTIIASPSKPRRHSKNDVVIEGIDNILVSFAKCCKPIPGDDIVGNVTKERGVTVHIRQCNNIQAMPNKDKLMKVNWVAQPQYYYPAELAIMANDRETLLRDITTLLNNKKLRLIQLSTHTSKSYDIASIKMTIEVNKLEQLEQLIKQMQQIPNIIDVRRVN